MVCNVLEKREEENLDSLFALKAIALIQDKSGGSLKISLKRLGRPKAFNSGWTRMTTTILTWLTKKLLQKHLMSEEICRLIHVKDLSLYNMKREIQTSKGLMA